MTNVTRKDDVCHATVQPDKRHAAVQPADWRTKLIFTAKPAKNTKEESSRPFDNTQDKPWRLGGEFLNLSVNQVQPDKRHAAMQHTERPLMNFYEQVYQVVRRIPSGKVTSYGHIARMLGAPNAARAVGYALRALKDRQDDPGYQAVPWHRVINSQGRISIVNREFAADEQARRLRAEEVVVDEAYCVDMAQYAWAGLDWLEIDDLLQESPSQ